MTEKPKRDGEQGVESRIVTVRGQAVILDYDLAAIYGVSTKRLNEQVKRNSRRFPEDFMFRLTTQEWTSLTLQIEMSSERPNRSQSATGYQRHRDPRFVPHAFTEHGAVMAANILRSERAIQMSVFVVRAFVRMRTMLGAQRDLARKLAALEKSLTARLDLHERTITDIIHKIMSLLSAPVESEPEQKRIGFHVRESLAPYKGARKKARP
jgi:hypothetical protein